MIKLVDNKDLDACMDIVKEAIILMRLEGSDQWDESYPTREHLAADIEENSLYGYYEEEVLKGFICINQKHKLGSLFPWQRESYLAVHRMAVKNAYRRQGVAGALLDFAQELALAGNKDALRSDTYSRNKAMQSCLKKKGFTFLGQINPPHTGKADSFLVYEKVLR